ncbi:tyrosine-type recombinase/integrase [Pseudomonas capsici]|uniref:tyrosine-type recombinase/integrase n=1 Tax=Pseudomonas capsici TaxID=2810614 RepID=UPI0021F21580|nr:site-specific integrase [Pseudomonas capsici]MCV4343253.1 site-specific integrase [Pseudomonas capsici]
MITRPVRFSEAEIRRQAADSIVRDIRDARYPGLYLRFHQDRERATWYLVKGRNWSPLAHYPEIGLSAMLAELPAIRQRLLADPSSEAATGFTTVGHLLTWYQDRMSRDRSLSKKRKDTAASAIKQHLQPMLASLPIAEVSAATIDEQFIWPAQAKLSLSYIRLMFGLLLTAFRQAQKLGLAPHPMAGMVFKDFTQARIKPKPSRLRAVQLPEIMSRLVEVFDRAPSDAMLALMMLAHGTRIGETRQARWSEISLPDAEWFIPAANTKTRTEHRLPLTAQVRALLTRYRSIQAARGYNGKYLFPNRRGLNLSDSQANSVFVRIGESDWTSHDLRKVSRTAWTDLGIDGHIAEMLLNHSLGKIASTYIHTQAMQQRRIALETWHNWLDNIGFQAIHNLTVTKSVNSQNTVQAANGAVCTTLLDSVIGEVLK